MTQDTPELPPAGWHPDPAGSDQERFWDGENWTAQLRAVEVDHAAAEGLDPDGASDLDGAGSPDGAGGAESAAGAPAQSIFAPGATLPPARPRLSGGAGSQEHPEPQAPLPASTAASAGVQPQAQYAPHSTGPIDPLHATQAFPATQPGGATPGFQPGAAPQPAYAGNGETGFFRSLFDLSFAPDRVVTIKFARVLYLLATIGSLLVWLVGALVWFVVSAISREGAFAVFGVLQLLFGWVFPLLTVVGVRVCLEVMISTIRTSQHTAQLVQQGERA